MVSKKMPQKNFDMGRNYGFGFGTDNKRTRFITKAKMRKAQDKRNEAWATLESKKLAKEAKAKAKKTKASHAAERKRNKLSKRDRSIVKPDENELWHINSSEFSDETLDGQFNTDQWSDLAGTDYSFSI